MAYQRTLIGGGGGGGGGLGAADLAALSTRFKTGQYYSCSWGGDSGSITGANTGYYMPFVVGEQQAFDRLAVGVTSPVAGSVVRIAIYTSDADGYPSTLVAGSEITVDSASSGWKEGVVSFTLTPGVYWAYVTTAVTNIAVRFSGAGIGRGDLLPLSVVSSDGRATVLTNTATGGNAPATAAWTGVLTAGPIVRMRAA